nr:frequenin-1-like [Rhipicephalus microplus]
MVNSTLNNSGVYFFITGEPITEDFVWFEAAPVHAGNGVITFKEFIRAISITTKGNIDEKLNWAFNLYDLDNDGFVTRSEMLDIVTAIYVLHGKAGLADTDAAGVDIPRKRVDQLFAKLDTDADARISREEFCEGFKTDPLIRRALLNAVSMPDQPKSLRSFSTTSSE